MWIKVHKDSEQNLTKLPFIAIDDVIFSVLESWPLKWCTLDLVGQDRIAAQKYKDVTKLCIT